VAAELLALDIELADYVTQANEQRDLAVTLDDYFVDVLAERFCDTNGHGSAV
jgi:hypothetical protein